MPAPLAAAGIAAAASLAGSGINAMAVGKTNRKTRKWNEKMYATQRADALADWNMQNEYNSPEQQMARLKAAGLNPHLVYGNGADATSNQAPRSSSVEGWRPQPAQWDVGGAAQAGIAAYTDLNLKAAQTDNYKAQTEVLGQDAVLKAIQAFATDVGGQKTAFELQQAKALQNVSLEMASEQLRNLRTNTDINLDTNERNKALAATSLEKSAEEILNIRAQKASTDTQRQQTLQQIELLKKDGVLKDLDIKLKKVGIQPNDPAVIRFLQQALDLSPEKIRAAGEKLLKTLQDGPPTADEWLKNNPSYQKRLQRRRN